MKEVLLWASAVGLITGAFVSAILLPVLILVKVIF